MRPLKITILIPVYDDWPSLLRLIGDIHVAMQSGGWSYEIVIVDDGSPNELPSGSEIQSKSEGCLGITLLRLGKNLGHQRAIAVIPTWATLLTVVLLVFGIHLLMLGFVFCLVILSQRQHVSFLPIRDVQIYVLEPRSL